MIIFWRGWGLIIIATAGLPMMFSMPAILSRMQAAPDQAITGHFAPPMLLSAILTFVAH